MKTQIFGIVAVLLLAIFAVPAFAAETFTVSNFAVYADGVPIQETQGYRVISRDSDLPIKVLFTSNNDINDVTVRVSITGNKDDIEDESSLFDVVSTKEYAKSFTLELPQRTNTNDYLLKVEVSGPNTLPIIKTYPLAVEANDYSVMIKDVVFSPSDKVSAGRALTAVARLKNYGQDTEKDVKVVLSIPELDVQETDYVNEIEKDDTVSTEEMLLRIPATAKSGEYTVKVDVYFNDGDDKTSADYTINVAGDDSAAQAVTGLSGKTTIAVGLQTQSVAKGQNGVIFPISLTNGASVAKTYTLSVSGADGWAVTKVSPSNVLILNAGETKQAYVYVAANENSAVGEHVFSVDVKVGNDVVQSIPLKADVLESTNSNAWDGVKKALSVGVILLVVLILALGAVVLYQKKFKSADESKDDEQIAQTYY